MVQRLEYELGKKYGDCLEPVYLREMMKFIYYLFLFTLAVQN